MRISSFQSPVKNKRYVIDKKTKAPREEVNRKYQLGKNTLNYWMQVYGSASWQAKKRRSYTAVDKRKIIAEIEQGVSLSAILR